MADMRPTVPLTTQHKSLAEFAGEWDAVELVYPAPGTQPIERKGRTTCRELLNGLATLMESELTNPDGSVYRSFVVGTWNVSAARLDGIFMDVHSFDGFDPMSGSPVRALQGDIALKRVWSGSVTLPRMASPFHGAPEQLLGVDRMPVQLSEHKIDDNKWVLTGMMTDAHGNQFVGLQWTFTRR